MGVKILKRDYKSQFAAENESTDWLIGNVGDWQKLRLTFSAEVNFRASDKESISIIKKDNAFVLNNGRKWTDYGFDIGDVVLLTFQERNKTNSLTKSRQLTILNLYSDTMEVAEDISKNFKSSLIPTNRGDLEYSEIYFNSTKEPEGVKITYNHILNEDYDSNFLKSVIDGTQTSFIYAGLDSLEPGKLEDMEKIGLQSGMGIESVKICKGDISNNNYDSKLKTIEPAFVRYRTNKQNDNYIYLNSYFDKIKGGSEFKRTHEPSKKHSVSFLFPSGNQIKSDPEDLFFKSSKSQKRLFNIRAKLKIRNASTTSSNNYIAIVLTKYSGSIVISQKILYKWEDVSKLKSQSINFNGGALFDLNEGDYVGVSTLFFSSEKMLFKKSSIQINSDYEIESRVVSDNLPKYIYTAEILFFMPLICENKEGLKNKIIPDVLAENGSLTDNFLIEIYPENNNPNTSIKNELSKTARLGNTGWFNENYNGLENDYKIESLNYYDSDGREVTSLDYNSEITIKAVISGIKDLMDMQFDSLDFALKGTRFGFGFCHVPNDEEDYKNNRLSYHNNLFVSTGKKIDLDFSSYFGLNEQTGDNIFEGYGIGGARMDVKAFDGVAFKRAGVDSVNMNLTFMPNEEFSSLFETKNERDFILWLSIGDISKKINFNNRVSLLIDYNTLKKTEIIGSEYPGMNIKFIEHPNNILDEGKIKYYGFIEDDLLVRCQFNVKKGLNNIINKQIFGFEVENKLTGKTFELERQSLNTSNIPLVNDTQEIKINQNRGLKLSKGNNKNIVSINRDKNNDTPSQLAYISNYGTKIRWEDWISKNSVPDEFFDPNKKLNGYNNNWLDYLRNGKNNYRINFFVITQVNNGNELINYKDTAEITFAGYNENPNIKTYVNFYKQSDKSSTNIPGGMNNEPAGMLLSDEPTILEIIYENLIGEFDLNKVFATCTVEIVGGSGRSDSQQISSIWDYNDKYILLPLGKNNKLTIEQISKNKVRTICLIDNNKLEKGNNYKFSGRIGCYTGANGDNNGIYEDVYASEYE